MAERKGNRREETTRFNTRTVVWLSTLRRGETMAKGGLLMNTFFGGLVLLSSNVSQGQTEGAKNLTPGQGSSTPAGGGAKEGSASALAKDVSTTEAEPSTKLKNSQEVSALLPTWFDPKSPDTPTFQSTPINDRRLQVSYRDRYGFKWTLEIQISENRDYLYFQLPCQPISAINREARLRQLLETNAKLGLIRFEMYRDTDMVYLTLPIENYAVTESTLVKKIIRLAEAARETQDIWKGESD
jgi:hypothetical protein